MGVCVTLCISRLQLQYRVFLRVRLMPGSCVLYPSFLLTISHCTDEVVVYETVCSCVFI